MGLKSARTRHESYQAKCARCMSIRRRMRQMAKLRFTQQIHYFANRDYFEDVDRIEFLDCHTFDYLDKGELAEVTKSRISYVGALSMEESESLAEAVAKDVASVHCLSQAPEVLRIGVVRIGEKLKEDLLERLLDMLCEEYVWVRRRDQEHHLEEWELNEDRDEDPRRVAAREEAFLRNLNLSLDQMIFFLKEAYEIGNEVSCGELPVVWLQPADRECCTFVTGCEAAPPLGWRSTLELASKPLE